MTIAIVLTTSLLNVQAVGPGRQYCVQGASSDFACDIYAADSTSSASLIKICSLNGANKVQSFPNDSSVILKYVVTGGSIGSGKVWVQGPGNVGSVKVDLATSAVDVSRITTNRTLVLAGGPAGLRISVYGADSTSGNFTLIAVLVADATSLARSNYLPNDSSVAMKYTVDSGTPTGATKVYALGGELRNPYAIAVMTSVPTYTVSGQVWTASQTGALAAQDVAVTPAVGNVLFMPEGATHATAADTGPWEVTMAGDTTTAATMRRPSWHQNGQPLNPNTQIVVQSGTVYSNSTWMNFTAGTIGTTAPNFVPDNITQVATLSTGAIAITNVPIASASKTSIRFDRTAVGGTVTATVMYQVTASTVGILSVASVTISAVTTTGALNTPDTSTGKVSIRNWG